MMLFLVIVTFCIGFLVGAKQEQKKWEQKFKK